MPFVLDASTTAAWCFPDEDDSDADIAFDRLSAEPAIVPALWWVEIRNILIIGERRRRIDAAETARFLADLDRLPIRIDNDPINDVLLTLARRHAITAYDALYLELAIRHAAPIATLDKRLAKAARDAGMPVIGKGP